MGAVKRTLENSWGEYILALNKFNKDLEDKYDRELALELGEYRKRPWYLKMFTPHDEAWIEMGNSIRLSRKWKEPSVEDCLTWIANNKEFHV